MRIPNLYINVHQTIFALLATGFVGCYIFNKEFRNDVNDVLRRR